MEHIKIPEDVQAMRTEREELEHSMFRLAVVITAPVLHGTPPVDEEELAEMKEQYEYMKKYFDVLTRRLARALAKV